VNRLTKREQLVLLALFVALLVGWAVKAILTVHPELFALQPVGF
jgi:hypothetical protein